MDRRIPITYHTPLIPAFSGVTRLAVVKSFANTNKFALVTPAQAGAQNLFIVFKRDATASLQSRHASRVTIFWIPIYIGM